MSARRASLFPPHPVRLRRIDLDFSQDDLAIRAGIARSVLSRVERFDYRPAYEARWRLALALGVPMVELWGEERLPEGVIPPDQPLPSTSSNGHPPTETTDQPGDDACANSSTLLTPPTT